MSFYCIGGLGGSGTRLVADALSQHGIFIGNSLNDSLDNLLFSLFFRRPSWADIFPEDSKIEQAIEIYLRTMKSKLGHYTSAEDEAYVSKIISTGDFSLLTIDEWTEHLNNHFSKNQSILNEPPIWGWKEPNTHVFLPQLYRFDANLKYIHVIRDGLYMMNSKNQQQMHRWGKHFNCKVNDELSDELNALNFWNRANEATLSFAKANLPHNFHVFSYDKYCKYPIEELEQLFMFLGLEFNHSLIKASVENLRYKTISDAERAEKYKTVPSKILDDYLRLRKISGIQE